VSFKPNHRVDYRSDRRPWISSVSYLTVHYLYRAIANGSATGCAMFGPTAASCEIKPEGGPSLGRFTLQRTGQDKWYISGHEKETC
jgi:hypothetical protein